MKREIKATTRTVTLLQPTFTSTADLRSWLLANAPTGSQWLLAHQENGVIWGEITNGDGGRTLTTSDQPSTSADEAGNIPATKFRLELLLECRVFGSTGELMLWRNENAWQARRYQEADSNNDAQPGASTIEYIDEEQILWGTQKEDADATSPLPDGFTLVADGAEGLRHAVPLANLVFAQGQPNKMYRPLRLKVRHYLAQDGDGMMYIYGSRLVNVESGIAQIV